MTTQTTLPPLQFHTTDVGSALWVMLLGMVGIFVVMIVVLITVALLNTFAKDKKKDDDAQGGKK